MFKTNRVKNVANLFTLTRDVGTRVSDVIGTAKESIFGVEVDITKRGAYTAVITPPRIRLGREGVINRRLDIKDMQFYEGFLSKPFFLPIYEGLDGELLKDLEKIPIRLVTGERVTIQWLFRRSVNWQERALGMYSSYLQGNDHPVSFNAGRALQDKVLQTLNAMSSTITEREYIEEVERKILSEGFQFQLRIGVVSDTEEDIIEHIKSLLKRYAAYNDIRLYPLKGKKVATHLQDCILSADATYHIISKGELVSLLGGEDEEVVLVNEVIDEVPQRVTNERRTVRVGEAIQLLPYIPREEIEVSNTIISDIAEAMKRVGLISTARIYNETITTGVRLTVVQFSIPKGKTLTQIQGKQKDISAAMGVPSLGVEQGELPDTVQVSIPNEDPTIISLRELLECESYVEFSKNNPLAFVVGLDEVNNPIYLSLSELVHLLVAGTTGSGKSVFINTIAISLMLSYSPEYLQMVMIDPKEVEMQHYEDFPHVREVITDMNKATGTLAELVREMDKRYSQFREQGVKIISAYNQKVSEKMPYIVCIIDEYADLRDTTPEVEDHIGRLGQKARAAGIHLIIATQRPSTDIISGRIKAVIPNAISFNLNNNTNYRTVFGTGIPYSSLLGKGDGVMKIEGYPKEFQRFQSSIITLDDLEEEEVMKNLAAHLNNLYGKGEKLAPSEPEPVEEEEDLEIVEHLYKLKQIIADTRETRVAPLRKLLEVKMSTMPILLGMLVEEGWLIKHDSRAKGYELIADEDILTEWKSN